VARSATKRIILTRGFLSIVDSDDYVLLQRFKWHVTVSSRGRAYAVRHVWNAITKKRTPVFMHRVIAEAPIGVQVDHKNNDGLDNRKRNLRLCLETNHFHGNHVNRSVTKGKRSSEFKGVFLKSGNRPKKPWEARISFDRRELFLGTFSTEIDAARAYDTAARGLYKEFAQLNEP